MGDPSVHLMNLPVGNFPELWKGLIPSPGMETW